MGGVMPEENETQHIESAERAESGGDAGQDWGALPEWARAEVENLRARLSDVNNESAERRIRLKEMNERMAALEADRQTRLTEAEKLKEAEAQLNSLRQFEDRAKALEARITESNAQRVTALPEHLRGLVPVDELSPEKLAGWLDKNESILRKPIAPSLDGGVSGGGGAKTPELTEEERRIAKRTGVSEDDYAKRKTEIEARRARRDG